MGAKRLLNNVTGSGTSPVYVVDDVNNKNTDVFAFLTLDSGSVTFQASADGINFAPLRDGQFTASEVVPMELAEGTFFRAVYSGVTNLNLSVTPKYK